MQGLWRVATCVCLRMVPPVWCYLTALRVDDRRAADSSPPVESIPNAAEEAKGDEPSLLVNTQIYLADTSKNYITFPAPYTMPPQAPPELFERSISSLDKPTLAGERMADRLTWGERTAMPHFSESIHMIPDQYICMHAGAAKRDLALALHIVHHRKSERGRPRNGNLAAFLSRGTERRCLWRTVTFKGHRMARGDGR